jgi:hypothetical protein
MIRIEVTAEPVERLQGKSKKTGADFDFSRQPAYLHNGHAYPDRFMLSVKSGEAPMRPGFYTLGANAIEVNRETGRLGFAYDFDLVPVESNPLGDGAKGK